ncbi:MAG: DUF192 domain-containing protein [Candidatus Micrarchaeota archaeon]
MRPYELAAFVAVAVLLIFAVSFIFAKGERKKATLTDQDGKKIVLDVEIADNPVTRAKGLMGRTMLGDKEGMLFVFSKPDRYGFWMFNTTIPLDAIHISENGSVVDVIGMAPCKSASCPIYKSEKTAKYVLEVNKGFAKKYGIAAGKSQFSVN